MLDYSAGAGSEAIANITSIERPFGYSAGTGGMSSFESIETRFKKLASRWRKETAHHSSMAQMAKHTAYKQILGLGPRVVRLMLEDMKQRPSMWFHALQTLTGANPVPLESRGIYEQMKSAWLRWGRENGYDT